MKTLEYLKSKEWSMGNGQCPECYGAHEGWLGHPCYLSPSTIGHKADCPLALSLKELGQEPLFLGQYKDGIEYEHCLNDQNIYSTRPKTEHGCPRLKKLNQEISKSIWGKIDEIIIDSLQTNLTQKP